MNKKVIVTMATTDRHKAILAETIGRMKKYAEFCEADFLAITNDDPTFPIQHYRKFKIIKDNLCNYDRVAWIDADVLISAKAPNIFDEVPEEKLGIFNEALWVDRSKDAKEWHELTGYALPPETYFNTGVMVLSKKHFNIFKTPSIFVNHYGEQTYLNQCIHEEKADIHKLSHHWNRMSCTHGTLGEEPFCSHFIHFAGDPNPNLPKFIRDTIEHWKKKDWTGEKRIAIIANMGMGNQIASVPAIKHLMGLHPDYKFTVQSHFPEVYEHLKAEGVEVISEEVQIPYPFALRKSTAFNGMIQDVASHPTDYHAQALLMRQLPMSARRVTVPVKSCAHILAPNAVVIHAGRSGWASKEMPVEKWQQIANHLKEYGFPVYTIGTKDFKNKNRHYKTGEKWGCFELENIDKNLTDLSYAETCDVIRQGAFLLTNDSMPVHAAGAFDNHIGLITIAKHPEFIIPYRYGHQAYRTSVWTGTPLWKVKKEVAVFEPENNFNWATMYEGMEWPDPETVASEIISILNANKILEERRTP